jgi:hypothetical protein
LATKGNIKGMRSSGRLYKKMKQFPLIFFGENNMVCTIASRLAFLAEYNGHSMHLKEANLFPWPVYKEELLKQMKYFTF